MPELPEVETIRQKLREGDSEIPSLLGNTISDVQVFWARSIAHPDVDDFRKQVIGETIEEIARRGKYFIFHLKRGNLIIHLRMSGDLIVRPQSEKLLKHDRLIFHLSSGHRLVFNDMRKFGRVWYVMDADEVIGLLGPEPLSPQFKPIDLYKNLQKHKRQIKPLLMDQSFLAGMGNIYTDEALHLAKIHPLTSSNRINYERTDCLWSAIRSVLSDGIANKGSSIDRVFRGGKYQEQFLVYHRKDQQCYTCGSTIRRIIVGQRGTHFCPTCQIAPD